MEEAAKSIEHLAKHHLPPFKHPHVLSISSTRKYRPHPDERRFEEQDIRPLQYTTLITGDADRGILLTRPYFSVIEDSSMSTSNAPTPTSLRSDPNKPKKKVSLKDYKNRKVEGESPPKSDGQSSLGAIKERPSIVKPVQPSSTKEMDGHRDFKKNATITKPESIRRRSPSPERRKRAAQVDESPKKRSKVDGTMSSAVGQRPPKDVPPQKLGRPIPPAKSDIKDAKSVPTTNGRSASNSLSKGTASPKPPPQVNGAQKQHTNSSANHKKGDSNNTPRSVPALLSPTLAANLSDLVKEDGKSARPSPKKKPAEASTLKPQPKKTREDREPSPSPKKRKIPPLLSPTLPPVVMEALNTVEKQTPLKEPSQKSSQVSDSPGSTKKAPKPSKASEAIPADGKREEQQRYFVTIKYRKRNARTIERLLNLPSGGKRKADRAARERSDSVEPGTARKRPRTTTDASEASKRPRTTESLRPPSTPPRQSTAMARIASNSSQAGTPGNASLTPAAQPPPDKQRPPLDPDRVRRAAKLHNGHRFYMGVGTKLKHERDGIMKSREGEKERERQIAMAAGTQSLLAYMRACQLQSDAFDMERAPRQAQPWKDLLPLFRVIRSDCAPNKYLVPLILRIHAICLSCIGRSYWFISNNPDVAEKAIAMHKEENEMWRQAEQARKRLGVYDGQNNSGDGGPVGKLIDRLGPWTTIDAAIPIALDILRQSIRIDGASWKPDQDLADVGRTASNGVPA
ncbi:hypothetical protein F5Y15DRAFT_351839 [Xylariaceae sp. FL0016]|nr:hypothetical protein F5Y15DRAFT_351839 [Xylariaceae sp. FL0016]